MTAEPTRDRPDLDWFRPYLRVLARTHLAPCLNGKFAPSDVVRIEIREKTLARLLIDLLTEYLAHSPACRWPGVDGVLVDDLLREYPAAATCRQVPDELELCERHPEFAAQIVAFFFLHTRASACHG